MLITGKAFSGFNNSKIYRILMGIITFHFVCFGWIFFRAEDFDAAMTIINQILFNFDAQVFWPFYENYKEVLWMIALAMAIHLIPDDVAEKFIAKTKTIPLIVYILVFFAFLILYGYFKSAEQVLPIYLQF